MCILKFVPELHSDLVLRKGEQLLAQTVVLFLLPLLGEELLDSLSPNNEGRSVSPDAVGRVGLRDHLRVSTVVSLAQIRRGQITHWVFHKSCAFLTLVRAESSVNGGARDMLMI